VSLRAKTLCLIASLSLILCTPSAAQAATASTLDVSGGCADKGGVWWQTLIKWGRPYLEVSTGTVRVPVDYVGWTTNARTIPTDSMVYSYGPDGTLQSQQALSATIDYVGGTRYSARNPRNPISGPGLSRIRVVLGKDGDGLGNCAVTSTQPSTAAAPIIAAVGDMACPAAGAVTATNCQQQAVSASILAAHVTNLLALGDTQYPPPGGTTGSSDDFRTSYEPSFGRLKAVTRPAAGHHDGTAYTAYFGSLTKPYYSFDVGGWHLVALDSQHDLTATGTQLAWLKADLAAHRNRCTLAYMHVPRFGNNPEQTQMQPMWDVLAAGDVDLVLAGHAHNYQAYAARDGITQMVVGTGGHSINPADPNIDGPLTQSHDSFGWLKLTLRPVAADLTFVPVVGQFTDTRTVACT
jgi:hypothetical protein